MARALRGVRLRWRIAGEDILGQLYRTAEQGLPPKAAPRFGSTLARAVALARLRWRGMVEPAAGGGWALTPAGHRRARALVRSHRLWEAYLSENAALPLDHLHEPAHRLEHYTDPPLRRALAGAVGGDVDPHGAAIPATPSTDSPANPDAGTDAPEPTA